MAEGNWKQTINLADKMNEDICGGFVLGENGGASDLLMEIISLSDNVKRKTYLYSN